MMLSCDVMTRFDSQLSRMNCQTFSTGLMSAAIIDDILHDLARARVPE